MKTVRLSRVARTISGTGFPPSEQGFSDGDFPFLKVSDLGLAENASRVVTAANWITRSQSTFLGVRVIPPDSVVFPKVGAALLGNARGHTAVPMAVDNNMMAVVPTSVFVRFLYWWLASVDMGLLSEGGTLPFVSDSAVRALRVPDVSWGTQQRVADFLDDRVSRIDRVIAARREQLAALDQVLASRRRDAILGKPELGTPLPWAQRVSSHHAVRRLSQLASMGTGHTPSKSHDEYWVDVTIPWLTTSDVHRFRRDEIDSIATTEFAISGLGLANSAAVLHPAGTVALSRTASAGFSIVMDADMATSQDFVTWTCGAALEPRFLLHSLRVMRPYLLGNLAMGSTHKTIYFPDLMDLRLPVPDKATQQVAVRQVAEASEFRIVGHQRITRSIDLLTEYKQSLITAAVTGQFDVTTASTRLPE